MEENKNGIISEEALENISGGLSVNKSTLKKVLIASGISIVGLATATVATKKYLNSKNSENSEDIDIGKPENFQHIGGANM